MSEPQTTTHVEQIDDPATGWAYFVALIGILLFLVAVYWADGAFFASMSRARTISAEAGEPGLISETVGAQTARIHGYAVREDADGDGKPVFVKTAPIDLAKERVLADLKAKQGR